MHRRHEGQASVIALVLLLASPADADRFVITPEKENRVQFVSKAPLETIQGKTREIRGHVVLDPASLGDSIDVYVEVDLASLDTGIGLRDKHMRENHLETDDYPKALFRGGRLTKVSETDLRTGSETSFRLTGEIELHGVRRRLQAPVRLTYSSAEGVLRVTTEFEVLLSEHEIPRPKFLVMQLDDVQRVTVDMVARRSPKP